MTRLGKLWKNQLPPNKTGYKLVAKIFTCPFLFLGILFSSSDDMDPCLRAERRQDKWPSDSRLSFSTSEKPLRRLLHQLSLMRAISVLQILFHPLAGKEKYWVSFSLYLCFKEESALWFFFIFFNVCIFICLAFSLEIYELSWSQMQ